MIQYFPTYVVLLPNLSIKSSTTFHISIRFQVQIFVCLLWTRNQMLKNQTNRISDFLFNDKSRSNKIILSLGIFALFFLLNLLNPVKIRLYLFRIRQFYCLLWCSTFSMYSLSFLLKTYKFYFFFWNDSQLFERFRPDNYDNTSSIYVQWIIGSLQTIHCLLSW